MFRNNFIKILNQKFVTFKNGELLRVSGKLIEDDRNEARQSMLDAYPSLQKMYKADDGIRKFSILKCYSYFLIIYSRTTNY